MLPGEIVTISPEKGIESDTTHVLKPAETARCIFEYIYFARPDSFIDGVSVYDSRILPESSWLWIPRWMRICHRRTGIRQLRSHGIFHAVGNPLRHGLREKCLCGQNLHQTEAEEQRKQRSGQTEPIREAVEGKRVIMIDDSIVRGTTSDRIVKMLREAGAKEVHMRVSSPPFLWPCYFGTDVPARDQLIAYNRSIKEISDLIGTDSLDYLKIERLGRTGGR